MRNTPSRSVIAYSRGTSSPVARLTPQKRTDFHAGKRLTAIVDHPALEDRSLVQRQFGFTSAAQHDVFGVFV